MMQGKIPMTLCIVHRDGQILLGMKKRGFGAGWWNGFGGKILPHESTIRAMEREMQEEAGIAPLDPRRRGRLTFTFKKSPDVIDVHIFSASEFRGEPVETEEMKPQWFPEADLPYTSMWPDDKYWYPLFLGGKNFTGAFHFKDLNGTISDYHVEETDMVF